MSVGGAASARRSLRSNAFSRVQFGLAVLGLLSSIRTHPPAIVRAPIGPFLNLNPRTRLVMQRRSNLPRFQRRGPLMTRLFAGGVIPRSNAAQIEFSRNELPPLGTVGRGQVHDALPEVAEFSEWVRQRRSGVTFQTILALRRARPEIDRAHAAGVEHARSGIVRIAEGQYQIPIVIRADRFGCDWQVEASFVSVVYGCVLRALGNPRDPAFLEFLLYTQFDAGPFDYYQPPTEVTGSTTTGRSTSRPLDDRGTRLAHRFTWLMARRGRHVTWDDWEVTRHLRRPPASPVQLANMDAVVRQGFNVGLETFALVPSSIRSVLPPEGLSVPPLLSLKFSASLLRAASGRSLSSRRRTTSPSGRARNVRPYGDGSSWSRLSTRPRSFAGSLRSRITTSESRCTRSVRYSS